MDELDHMLNGKGSRQHHQDILRWTRQERFASEVEAAQGHQKTGMRTPGIAYRTLAALLTFTTANLNRNARRASDKTLQVNRWGFIYASDKEEIEAGL